MANTDKKQLAMIEETIQQVKNAITEGRTDILNTVLESCNKFGEGGSSLKDKILNEICVEEGTFLHLSTKLGLKDVTRALLISGSNPTVENSHGENAFELAANESMQQVYIEELLRATAASDLARMDQLIKAGVDPNSWDCDEKLNTILHWSVCFGSIDTITYLIEKGADVNCVSKALVSPLHDAVDRGDVQIVQLLLQHGASPLIKAEEGKFADQSPLDLASKKPEIFSLMSHYLAAQFRNRTKRSSSIESVFTTNGGPESPIFPKDSNNYRSPPHERQRNISESAGDSTYLYSGFNSALDLEGVIRGLQVAPIKPIVTDTNLNLLWPQPKSLSSLEGLQFRPEKVLHLSVVKSTASSESIHRIFDIFSTHKDTFEQLGFDVTAQQVENAAGSSTSNSLVHSSQIQCCINAEVLNGPGSYRLHISSQKVRITAADLNGLNYAISTFLQLLMIYANKDERSGIPSLIINDYPTIKHRAVLLDISQERIATIESLFELIQLFSLLKINFLHLQARFNKTGSLVAYTKGEIVAMDRHCSDSCINLVPAIEVLPDVTRSEFFKYVKPALQEILPCFASTNYVHIGPQLTSLIFMQNNFSLSPNIDFGTLWDFIPISPTDCIIMLCYNAFKSQIPSNASSILLNMPSNVILVEYGFQADYNFGVSLQELSQNGCNTAVAVGTCSWSSLSGCPEASFCNIYHGILNAVQMNSLGVICANWSGSCNFTSRPFAMPGFLLSAGLSWNHQTHWEYLQYSLGNLMSTYVFKDKSNVTGHVILQLGCTEANLQRSSCNQTQHDLTNLPASEGSTLYRLLRDPDNVSLEHLSMESFVKCIRSIKKCQASLLLDSKLQKEDNPVLFDELCLTIELMLAACRIGRSLVSAGANPRSNMGLTVVNLGIANLAPTTRTDIANKLLILIEEYRRVWLLQNFSQGIEISLYSLTSVLQRFIPDSSRLLTGRLTSHLSTSSSSSTLVNGNGNS